MSPNLTGIVGIYAAFNALLVLVLSYNVGQNRARTHTLTPGALGDDRMIRAMRAHGNATEYIPLAMILLLILALQQAPAALLHSLGAAFSVGRVIQAIGMGREVHPNAIRFTGNLLTGLVYLAGSLSCLFYSLQGWH